MTWHSTRPVLISIVTVSLILSVSTGIIAYGRGYRLNLGKPTQLSATGIISATSDPVGAQVLVDTKLKTATNNSFNLAPGWYTVTIRKEAYIPWEKKLRVQGEVVTRADAYLFPTSPSLSPITTSGILAPTVSPDGNTVAFIVPVEAARNGVKKPGLYTLELADRPLGGRNRDPKFVSELSISSSCVASVARVASVACPTLLWSPDNQKIIMLEGKDATLYDLSLAPRSLDEGGRTPLTPISLTSLLADWHTEQTAKDRQKLASFKQGFVDVATGSARILAFSPDETKLLYEATRSATIPRVIDPPLIGTNATEESRTIKPGSLYVYDSREDRNYFLLEKKELPVPTPSPTSPRPPAASLGLLDHWIIGNSTQSVAWFPTNRHVLLTLPGKIDVMEYDRTNWATLYSGPFDGNFLTPWPTGSRIVILTNLNPGAGSLPNLYTVNLR